MSRVLETVHTEKYTQVTYAGALQSFGHDLIIDKARFGTFSDKSYSISTRSTILLHSC